MASEPNAPPSQNDAESVKKETQPTYERYYQAPFPSSTEIKFPRRIEENYNASQKKQETREKWKIILEGLTVLFVFGSMVVSWYMWNEMRKSTDAAKLSADAAAASTAAWIAEERFVIKSIEKDEIIFEVVFRNIGKTPALDAQAGWEFTFINASRPNDFTDIPKRDPFQCPEKMSMNLGILPPDKTWGNTIRTESGRMSTEQVQSIKNRTAKLVVHLCAKYRDIFSDRERITEIGRYFPGTFDDMAVGIYAPYSRMK